MTCYDIFSQPHLKNKRQKTCYKQASAAYYLCDENHETIDFPDPLQISFSISYGYLRPNRLCKKCEYHGGHAVEAIVLCIIDDRLAAEKQIDQNLIR